MRGGSRIDRMGATGSSSAKKWIVQGPLRNFTMKVVLNEKARNQVRRKMEAAITALLT